MEHLVLMENHGDWRKLTLNRPDKLNAFNAAMHHALSHALAEASADVKCRALLITGSGRAFCAGQDLESARDGHDLGNAIERWYNPLIRRIRGMGIPVVCAVNGVAAGAGANLALACDIVLAARSASFVQAFIRIGLIPDSGGTWFLPRFVGAARARGLAMLGEKLDAERAEAWGMIWKCLDDDALAAEAEAMTAHLATQPTHVLFMIKRAIDAAESNSLDKQLDMERDLQHHALRSHDHREGVKAFLEKRKPVFTGHDK
jgi:2-(1,2-epoxy-1,2-dihydrophenyl)acetyl-CoA isomerase